jgi:hypothetical protein
MSLQCTDVIYGEFLSMPRFEPPSGTSFTDPIFVQVNYFYSVPTTLFSQDRLKQISSTEDETQIQYMVVTASAEPNEWVTYTSPVRVSDTCTIVARLSHLYYLPDSRTFNATYIHSPAPPVEEKTNDSAKHWGKVNVGPRTQGEGEGEGETINHWT